MARYDREFLVPYLQDVCALYMAERVVSAKIFGVKKRILQLNRGESIDAPKKEEGVPEITVGRIVAIVGAVAFLIMLWVAWQDTSPREYSVATACTLITAPICLWGIYWGISRILRAMSENREAERNYENAKKEYQRNLAVIQVVNENNKKKVPGLEKKLDYYSEEHRKIARLLKEAYSANVIPNRYRDEYSAVYLYDFFSSGRSDDLDAALSLYVLEQIKDRLDHIIRNQQEEILNQRLILANQRTALEEQRAHYAYMEKKAKQIAVSMEEQNQYLDMVECNTAATAYFSAAQYLRS